MQNLRNILESLGIESSDYSDKEIDQAFEEFPVLWILKHGIKNESGFPLDFSKRRFQIDMYNDMSPKQVTLKPPQIGETVKNLVKSFFVAKKKKKDIIYTLPTDGDIKDMAGGKINRIVAQNPIFQEWVKDHDSVEQKQVGDNIIYYRSTWASKAAMMVSSSLNMHDELDASNMDVVTQYQTRQEAQDSEDDKWRWVFSHPSVAGFGVDVYWQMSDKKEWVITCDCGKQQILTWPESIDSLRKCYQCKYCKAELSDETRIWGEWKKTAKGEWSGYHVSQLMLYNKTAKDILDAFNDPLKNEQYFYNYVLGLPYVGSENKIPSSVVMKNVVPEVNEQGDRIIIGVDTGTPWYLTCMNKQGVFYHEQLKRPGEQGVDPNYDPKERLRELLKKWPTSIVIGDQGGDLSPLRILQAQMPGRVYLCQYKKDRKKKEMITWGEDDQIGMVYVDRNDYFQLMVEHLRDTGRIRINGTPEEWSEWAEQFDNVYREIKTTMEKPGKDSAANYGVELIWKRNGPDHYCFVAGTKIATNLGDRNVEDIKEGDLVYTRNGYKRVYDAGLRRRKQEVYTAYFSNGSSFTATGDHPVIHTKGKDRLDSLSCHAILYECLQQKKSSITESFIDDTRNLQGDRIGFTSHQTEAISQKDTRDCISRYGLIPMELFLKVLSYIIKTKIHLITNYLTWCAKVERNIKATMRPVDLTSLIYEKKTGNICRGLGSYPMNGGVLKQEKRGIRIMLIKASFWLFPKYLRVLSAVLKVLHAAIKAVSSVPQDVVIVGLHVNIVKKDVINISVEDEHEYFANGILVSNCHTLLYCLVGMDKYGNASGTFIPKTDMNRFQIGTRTDNSISGKRILGRLPGYVDF